MSAPAALPAEASIAVARGYNDWLSQEYTAVDPARLIGVGLLPAATLQDSIDELPRIARLPGVRGLQLQQWPNGSGAPAPEDDYVLVEVVDSGVAMVAHTDFGGGHMADPTRVPEHFFTISFLTTKGGAPYSASELGMTGVFDRIPDLRVTTSTGASPGSSTGASRPTTTISATATGPDPTCRIRQATTSRRT